MARQPNASPLGYKCCVLGDKILVICKGLSTLQGSGGKGQGKDFMTLSKPLTLLKGQGFFKGFSGVCISLISRNSRCCMPIKLSLNNVE